MSVTLGVLHEVWNSGGLQCQDFLCSGCPEREPWISGQTRGRGKNSHQALVQVETVDPAGAADKWCSVCIPSLAYEGSIRATIHVGQSCSEEHSQCIPNMPDLLHICHPLVQKPVFLGHGGAPVHVVYQMSACSLPWATPDPKQVSHLFAEPMSPDPAPPAQAHQLEH